MKHAGGNACDGLRLISCDNGDCDAISVTSVVIEHATATYVRVHTPNPKPCRPLELMRACYILYSLCGACVSTLPHMM
jgi:hypothetical protein